MTDLKNPPRCPAVRSSKQLSMSENLFVVVVKRPPGPAEDGGPPGARPLPALSPERALPSKGKPRRRIPPGNALDLA